MNALTWIQRRYTGRDPSKIEEFSSASRSINSGMCVCPYTAERYLTRSLSVAITSAWVWAAVFLQVNRYDSMREHS